MEGLHISTSEKALHRISQPSYELSLLATNGKLEVVTYELHKDMPCNVYPGKQNNLMEFYFVMEGTVVLKLEDGDMELTQGDYFYTKNLKEFINFTTRDGAKILCFTSEPSFKDLQIYQEALCNLLEQAEAKDPYTYHHGIRVQGYAQKIGERLGIADKELYTLQVASLFHDIGKYFVPDTVLKKPGKLTAAEYACIKKHSADSARLLKGKYDARILKAVRQHHERLDGSGYPTGLKGAQIILQARIIAVADAYDAMTSDRSYHIARSPQSAICELESLTHQYDERVIQALRSALEGEGVLAPVNSNL